MCSKKQIKKETLIEEIQEIPEKEIDVEIAEELIFDSPDKASDEKDNLLDILMGSDVEEDEEEDEEDNIKIDDEEIDLDDEDFQGGSNSDKKKKKIKIVDNEKDEENVKKEEFEGKKLEKDVTGMNLLNPNPFYKRMESRDPKLFQTDIDGKFKAYSRLCPWNVKRQPVILTDEEKSYIDKKHPDSYDEAIKYGSTKDNQYWYICPRYWSLKYNTSLTEDDVKSGKYEKIIPDNSKKVPKDS